MKMQLALIHLEATFVNAWKGILKTLHFAKVRTGIIVRIKENQFFTNLSNKLIIERVISGTHDVDCGITIVEK